MGVISRWIWHFERVIGHRPGSTIVKWYWGNYEMGHMKHGLERMREKRAPQEARSLVGVCWQDICSAMMFLDVPREGKTKDCLKVGSGGVVNCCCCCVFVYIITFNDNNFNCHHYYP